MLHTVSKSSINALLVSSDDAVLFWQNGVNLTLQKTPILDEILAKTTHCYALKNDIVARGLCDLIDPRVNIITMDEVVKLTQDFYPQLKW